MKKYLRNLLYSTYAGSHKNLSSFKNIHKNETCYIIGDGASIKWFDLKTFNDKPTFILSYLFFHHKISEIGRPIYGLLSEPYYFYPYFRLPWPPHTLWKNNIQRRYRKFIKQYSDSQFFVNLASFPVLRKPNVNYLFKSIHGSRFSDECWAQNIHPFHGSLRCAINLAIFMGFSKIILVGCDYTHLHSRSRHWYEFGPGILIAQENYNKDFFELAKKYVDIITLTLEAGSSCLPFIEYEKYANKPPLYVENYDLIDKADLLLLNTWPDYKIFPNC